MKIENDIRTDGPNEHLDCTVSGMKSVRLNVADSIDFTAVRKGDNDWDVTVNAVNRIGKTSVEVIDNDTSCCLDGKAGRTDAEKAMYELAVLAKDFLDADDDVAAHGWNAKNDAEHQRAKDRLADRVATILSHNLPEGK